jgi:hypothetical protein
LFAYISWATEAGTSTVTSPPVSGVTRIVYTVPLTGLNPEVVALVTEKSLPVNPVTTSEKVAVTVKGLVLVGSVTGVERTTVGARVLMVIFVWADVLSFPAASVKVVAATEIIPVPEIPEVGVKVALYPVPLPANAERVPQLAVISQEPKFTDGSERVNVIAEVAPEFTLVGVAPIVIVGTIVSITNVLFVGANEALQVERLFTVLREPIAVPSTKFVPLSADTV